MHNVSEDFTLFSNLLFASHFFAAILIFMLRAIVRNPGSQNIRGSQVISLRSHLFFLSKPRCVCSKMIIAFWCRNTTRDSVFGDMVLAQTCDAICWCSTARAAVGALRWVRFTSKGHFELRSVCCSTTWTAIADFMTQSFLTSFYQNCVLRSRLGLGLAYIFGDSFCTRVTRTHRWFKHSFRMSCMKIILVGIWYRRYFITFDVWPRWGGLQRLEKLFPCGAVQITIISDVCVSGSV